MTEIEGMFRSSNIPEKPITPEPKAEPQKEPVKEETPKPESGPDKTQQQEDTEEELPEGVKKRIAKESERAARIQSEIDRAVSTRKAKEQELASLKGKPGSEPEKHTEPAKDAEPQEPDLATFSGNLAEYNAAMKEFRQQYRDWVKNETAATVKQELQQQQLNEARKQAWDEATVKHGKDFPAMMDSLAENTPVDFQRAVSDLDDWSGVAVHLAKNEAERNALVAEFKLRPFAVIAKLGKLEDRLKPEAKASTETLPKPLKPVGGGPTGANTKVDLNDPKLSYSEIAKELERMSKTG